MENKRRVVIVGAGAAGCATAVTLRRLGFDGALTILEGDQAAPYDRPPLSKAALTGQVAEVSEIGLLPEARRDTLAIDLVSGATVTQLDSSGRRVGTEDGRWWEYDDLVIATGVRPRQIPGLAGKNIFNLYTWEEATALREALTTKPDVVVIGAGFLGLEIAATAASRGCRTTVVAPEELPLAPHLGPQVATKLVEKHRNNGVQLITGELVTEVTSETPGDGQPLYEVRTAARSIPASVVVVAVGSKPDTTWLNSSGLDVANGIGCGHDGNAAPGIWAVGDVASRYSPRHDAWQRREHRSSAADQGTALAHALLGLEPPVERAPFFWTDQYDVKVQVWGDIPAQADARVLEGAVEEDSFVLGFAPGESEENVAIVAWNAVKPAMKHRLDLDRRHAESIQAAVS